MPQELFIVAYVCNPTYRFEGLNESQEMLSPFALCAAVGQMNRVMFGAELSADELQVSVNRIHQQVICVSGSPPLWSHYELCVIRFMHAYMFFG